MKPEKVCCQVSGQAHVRMFLAHYPCLILPKSEMQSRVAFGHTSQTKAPGATACVSQEQSCWIG